MALPAIGDGEQVGDGNTSETLNVGRSGQALQIGGTAATLVGFHGASPVDQAAVVATVSTGTLQSGFGFSTSAQLVTAISAINSILDCLKEKGLMASS
jgi:hypothetical protein